MDQDLYAGVEDALYLWTLGGQMPSLGLCAGYLDRFIERHQPPPPKLWSLPACAVGSMGYKDFE